MECGEAYKALINEVYRNFSDAGDYIWKAPRLVEAEYELERNKLDEYFPLTGNAASDANALTSRALRWAFQELKLVHAFPSLMASGNLLLVVSLYEFFILKLVKLMEAKDAYPLSACKGQGLSRFFEFLNNNQIDYKRVESYDQVAAALAIRNCLYHANGLLAWSREESKLRHMVRTVSYLPKEIKQRQQKEGRPFDEVSVQNSELGDRLQITNNYSFHASAYLRDHLIGICVLAGKR